MNVKNILAVLVVATAIATTIGWIGRQSASTEGLASNVKHHKELFEGEEGEGGIPEKTRADLAFALEFEKTKDPATGTVPKERLLAAKAYADQLRASNKVNVALAVDWVERGPTNVGGRTRAILIDPNDVTGNTVFVGSVGGGLFKCTNAGSASPTWTPVNDFLGNLAITSIVADPSNPLVMYFSTGEGYGNSDATRGLGIFKSVDGGANWAQLASTNIGTFAFTQRLAVNATGIVFAATATGGLQRSTNGGTSWAKVLGTGLGITGAGSNIAWDVEVAANGDIYGSLNGSIHKSTNAGATFAAAMALPFAAARIEIACAPSDANYAYVTIENGSVVAGIAKTVNGGTSWVAATKPADADPGIPAGDYSRSQAWYDLTITVDPLNRDRIWTGGVDAFVSANGGTTWQQVSHWYGGFGFQYMHADQHIMAYQPGSSTVAYFGHDGGITRTANANAGIPTVTTINNGYNVTQFYSCAMTPTVLTDYFLAGAQDNGSQQFTNGGLNATVEVTGGDGSFCHIDQDQSQFQWTSYVFNDYFRSTDGGASWTNVTHSASSGRFINPSDYDNVNNRMYAARSTNQYVRWDNPQTGATFAQVAVPTFSGQVSAVTVSPNTANRVFFGTGSGTLTRCDNAHTGAPTATSITGAGMPGSGYVSCIEVETGDDNHLLCCFSNYGVNSIWESVNGGTSWTSVEGNMPDMPVRWLLFNPNDDTQALAATELGVWYTDQLNGASTVWVPGNSGLANVRTEMMQMRTSDKLVVAATHGRGLYTSDVFTNPTALFHADKEITYVGKTVQFTDDSYRSTSWSWNFGDGSPLSTLQHPTHVYTGSGKYDVTLTINGGASTLTKTAYVQILPDRGTPYLTTDGGNFEVNVFDFGPNNLSGTPFEWGSSLIAGKSGTVSPTHAWVTGLLATNYADNGAAQLWCPSYNMSAAGVYTLGFSSKFVLETGFDGFRVEYSLDKGDTWLPVGTTVAAGWYNNANNSGAGIFPANEAWFSGSVGGAYVNYTRNISFLAGNANVAFRFNFGSDVNTNGAGIAIDDFFINGPSNPSSGLAVSASPLAAEWKGKDVEVTWKTFVESNNAGFTVQRSDDGVNFSDLSFIQGAGTSNVTHDYTYTDATAVADHYFYRYRQLDADGNTTLSNIAEISRAASPRFDAFPNPFTDALNIRLAFNPNGSTSVLLWSMNGQKVLEIQPNWFAEREARIDIANGLAEGMYLLEVRHAGTQNFKMVKHSR
jgi:PKD repeat protein